MLRQRLVTIGFLALVLFAMDQLYRWLHPEVDFVRATLVGATAWLGLRALARPGLALVPAPLGGAAIFASAAGSVALIEAGWLVSRSGTSVAVHLALLAIAVVILDRVLPARQRPREATS